MLMKYITHSVKETKELAKELVKSLKAGQVIGLSGDLGAGKTAFTQGLAKALGVKSIVNSPTFVLMKVYEAQHKVIKTLVHIDAYRLDEGSNLEALGIEEYMADPQTLVVVEWVEKIKKIMPKGTQYYNFKVLSEDQREVVTK